MNKFSIGKSVFMTYVSNEKEDTSDIFVLRKMLPGALASLYDTVAINLPAEVFDYGCPSTMFIVSITSEPSHCNHSFIKRIELTRLHPENYIEDNDETM